MKFAIRVDSSSQIGTGHVVRTLTFAHKLKQLSGIGADFFCADLPGNLSHFIQESGFRVQPAESIQHLAPDYAGLLVDHYQLDAAWENQMARSIPFIAAIDDLADRPHACSLLIDQNILDETSNPYARLCPPSTQFLLGPQYALLRDAFAQAHQREKKILSKKNVAVFFGGQDAKGHAWKTVQGLLPLTPELTYHILTGSQDGFREKWHALKSAHVVYHGFSENPVEKLLACDFFLGAGGTVTWERLCIGLPGVVVSVASNQDKIAKDLANRGLQKFLGKIEDLTIPEIAATLNSMQISELQSYSDAGKRRIDGRGCERVVESIVSKLR